MNKVDISNDNINYKLYYKQYKKSQFLEHQYFHMFFENMKE